MRQTLLSLCLCSSRLGQTKITSNPHRSQKRRSSPPASKTLRPSFGTHERVSPNTSCRQLDASSCSALPAGLQLHIGLFRIANCLLKCSAGRGGGGSPCDRQQGEGRVRAPTRAPLPNLPAYGRPESLVYPFFEKIRVRAMRGQTRHTCYRSRANIGRTRPSESGPDATKLGASSTNFVDGAVGDNQTNSPDQPAIADEVQSMFNDNRNEDIVRIGSYDGGGRI